MALRFYYEFQNDKADTYRVEIHDANFASTETEISPQGEGFVLRYDGDSESLFQPVVGSHCRIPIYNRSAYSTEMDDFLDDLLVSDEDRFTVAIYFDPDGTNDLYWAGVILSDQTEIEDAAVEQAQRIDLLAADDVANLKYIEYTDDGTAYEGLERLSGHLLNCLNKTRTTDFWDTDDVFMRIGNFFKTQGQSPVSEITASFIGFQHEEMYDTNSFGVVQYPTAYDIVYQICETLMLSLCMTDGAWTLVPRHRHPTSPTPGYATYKKGGPKISNNVLIGNGYTIGTGASDIRRIGQFEYSHLNPARLAKREYEFAGNVPVIAESAIVESDFGVTTFSSSGDYIVPSGVELQWTSTIKIDVTGDATRTGDNRAVRLLFRATVKCGNYYLNRAATLTTNLVTPFSLNDGADVNVFLAYNTNAETWTTDSSNRFEYITNPIDFKNGYDGFVIQIPFGNTTPGLPADSNQIDVEIDVIAYIADGTTSAAIDTAAYADADIQIQNFRVYIGNGDGGDTLFFQAEADNNARDVIELERALIGDNLGDVASRGSLRFMSDGSYTTNNWHQIDTTDYDFINTQLVKQHLYQRREVTSLLRGTVYFDTIFMYDWVSYESRRYLPFALTFYANRSEYDIELFHVQENTNDITAAEPDRNDGEPGTGGGTDIGVGLGFGLMIDQTNEQIGRAFQSLDTIQPAGTGGLSVRENVGDTNRQSITTETLTGNRTLTLPDADVDFTGGTDGDVMTLQADGSIQLETPSGGGGSDTVLLHASANVGNTGQNRYIPFGGNSTDTSSIQIYTEALMPFDGEWQDVAIKCASTPGTCTARIWKNGVEQASAAVTGTAVVLDFSTNTFSAGDKLAFSLHCSSAPGDVWVGAEILKS